MSVHFVHDTAFSTVRLASTNHGRTDDASPMAANFTSRVGPCVGIVEPSKHVLHVTTHPQILALDLQAPTGVFPRQYGSVEDKEKVLEWKM